MQSDPLSQLAMCCGLGRICGLTPEPGNGLAAWRRAGPDSRLALAGGYSLPSTASMAHFPYRSATLPGKFGPSALLQQQLHQQHQQQQLQQQQPYMFVPLIFTPGHQQSSPLVDQQALAPQLALLQQAPVSGAQVSSSAPILLTTAPQAAPNPLQAVQGAQAIYGTGALVPQQAQPIYESPGALLAAAAAAASASATAASANPIAGAFGLNRQTSSYLIDPQFSLVGPGLQQVRQQPMYAVAATMQQQGQQQLAQRQTQQQPFQLQRRFAERKVTLNAEIFRQLETIEKQVDTSLDMELVERHGIVITRALDPYSLMPHLTETTLRRYQDHYLVSEDYVIRFIEIIKRPGQTLGLYIRSVQFEDLRTRVARAGLVITKVDNDSPIYNSSVLHVGDEIISVNLIEVQGMSLDDVVTIMSIPRRLVLALRMLKERDQAFDSEINQQRQRQQQQQPGHQQSSPLVDQQALAPQLALLQQAPVSGAQVSSSAPILLTTAPQAAPNPLQAVQGAQAIYGTGALVPQQAQPIYESPGALLAAAAAAASASATAASANPIAGAFGLNRQTSSYLIDPQFSLVGPGLQQVRQQPMYAVAATMQQQGQQQLAQRQTQQQPFQLQRRFAERKVTLNAEIFRQLETIEKQVDTSLDMELVERHGIVITRALDPYSLMPHLTETTLRRYQDHYLVSEDYVIRFIEIIKRPGQTLGLYIRSVQFEDLRTRVARAGLVITKVDNDSPIYNSSVLHVGDEIISVNLIEVQGMSLDDVVTIMSIPRRLVLALRMLKERDQAFDSEINQQRQRQQQQQLFMQEQHRQLQQQQQQQQHHQQQQQRQLQQQQQRFQEQRQLQMQRLAQEGPPPTLLGAPPVVASAPFQLQGLRMASISGLANHLQGAAMFRDDQALDMPHGRGLVGPRTIGLRPRLSFGGIPVQHQVPDLDAADFRVASMHADEQPPISMHLEDASSCQGRPIRVHSATPFFENDAHLGDGGRFDSMNGVLVPPASYSPNGAGQDRRTPPLLNDQPEQLRDIDIAQREDPNSNGSSKFDSDIRHQLATLSNFQAKETAAVNSDRVTSSITTGVVISLGSTSFDGPREKYEIKDPYLNESNSTHERGHTMGAKPLNYRATPSTSSTLPRRTLPTRPDFVPDSSFDASSPPPTSLFANAPNKMSLSGEVPTDSKQPILSNIRLGDTPEQSSYFSSSIDAINRELKELRRQRMALSGGNNTGATNSSATNTTNRSNNLNDPSVD